jgi:hypothetical protein
MAMGHVILKRVPRPIAAALFRGLCAPLHGHADAGAAGARGRPLVPDRFVRASDFADNLGEANNPEWKTVAIDDEQRPVVVPLGSIGFRWGEQGKWNLEEKDDGDGETALRLSLIDGATVVEHTRSPFPISAASRTRTSRVPDMATCCCARAGAAHRARDGDKATGGHGVRPVPRQLRCRPRTSAATRAPSATTTTCPTRRPGRRRSPACRATDHHGRPPIRRQRRQDQGQVDGDPRGRRSTTGITWT